MNALKPRLDWVDNVRTAMIILVVNMHACVTYSHVGGWYTKEGPPPPASAQIGYIFWQGHLQAFFMGLLFFLAGYFAHQSFSKRTRGQFVRDRLYRLGIPTLFFMLVIQPLTALVILDHQNNPNHLPLLTRYTQYVVSGRFLSGSGPLWFAFALLLFSLVYAGVGTKAERTPDADAVGSGGHPPPAGLKLAGFAMLLVIGTFLFRLFQPIDSSVLNFQFCFFAQYILVFIAGIKSSQQGWLVALAEWRVSRILGISSVFLGPVLLLSVLKLSDVERTGDFTPFKGGWHWEALGLAAWEQVSGLGLALGVMHFAQRYFNGTSRAGKWLSAHSFGVYVLHTPVLVGLTLAFAPLHWAPFYKMLLLTFTGLIGSYVVAMIAKRIPGLGPIL